MPILKVSETLLKLSEEKLRLPVPIVPSEMGPCPACGDEEWNGQVCTICGYVGESEIDAMKIYEEQQSQQKSSAKMTICDNCNEPGQTGEMCSKCDHPLPPKEFWNPDTSFVGISKEIELRIKDESKPKKKKKAAQKDLSDLGDVESDITTFNNEIQEDPQEDSEKDKKQGATMSRFEDEFTKESAVPGIEYDQTSTINLDSWGASSQSPAPQVDAWKDIYPERFLNVQDLDEPNIQGGPGSNAVVVKPEEETPEVSPQVKGDAAGYQTIGVLPYNVPNKLTGSVEETLVYPGIEESLYKVYEASRDLRKEIKDKKVPDFSNLKTRLSTVLSELKSDKKIASRQQIGEIKSLIKFATAIEEADQLSGTESKEIRKSLKEFEAKLSELSKTSTNGNQETDFITDVRNLDDASGPFDRSTVMTPDDKTNVLVPNAQPNQLALADVPDYYNDGGETGRGLAYNFDHRAWPDDPTNPAFGKYNMASVEETPEQRQATIQAAVQEAREKTLSAFQLTDRLERLGMVQHEDRAKHIARFEQMSPAALEGYKEAADMFEKTGARSPRVAKVSSSADGVTRLPEMGQVTVTAAVTRQDVQADDFLMTIN